MKKIINSLLVLWYGILNSFANSFKVMAHFEHADENKHHRNLQQRIMSLQHLDEDFEEDLEDLEVENIQTEYFEAVDNYKRKGQPDSLAQRNAQNRMMAKYGKSKTGKALRAGAPLRALSTGIATSAIFVLTFTRATIAINKALPVPLFGAIHQYDGYATLLNPYLPAGVTCTISNQNGEMLLTYTDGVNTDTILVSCSSIPFLSLMNATLVNMFSINRVRYALDSVDNLIQFSQTFDIVPKTMFGAGGGKNQVPISSFRDPKNNQSAIIDAPIKVDIDNETAIIVGVAPKVQTLTLDFNVNKFDTRNRKKLA